MCRFLRFNRRRLDRRTHIRDRCVHISLMCRIQDCSTSRRFETPLPRCRPRNVYSNCSDVNAHSLYCCPSEERAHHLVYYKLKTWQFCMYGHIRKSRSRAWDAHIQASSRVIGLPAAVTLEICLAMVLARSRNDNFSYTQRSLKFTVHRPHI